MADKVKGVNWHILAVFVLAFGLFLAGLNRSPVPVPDGAVRATMAEHVFRTGQLWPLSLHGETRVDHPPLYEWLSAGSFKVFGVNDFAANFVPRFFAFLTFIMIAGIVTAAGYGVGVAFLAALILAFTRDFVSSALQGFPHSVSSFFYYSAFWLLIKQQRSNKPLAAMLAAVSVCLAANTEGLSAFWPIVFFAFAFGMAGRNWKGHVGSVLSYIVVVGLICVLWAIWVDLTKAWPYWHELWKIHVPGKLGIGPTLPEKPAYFVDHLVSIYEPWIWLVLWCCIKLIPALFAARAGEEGAYRRAAIYPLLLFIFSAGLVIGFSFVKRKTWHDIVPAYPGLALFIAIMVRNTFGKWISWAPLARVAFYAVAVWVLVAVVSPARAPQGPLAALRGFRQTILNSPVPDKPVWLVRITNDRDLWRDSADWYFQRPARLVPEQNEIRWQERELKTPAWIISETEALKKCQLHWCNTATRIGVSDRYVLLHY